MQPLRIEPVVRHTMQALPLRSMSKSNLDADKTKTSVSFRLMPTRWAIVFLLCALVVPFSPSVLAQQHAALQPCSPAPCVSQGQSTATAPAREPRVSQTLIDSSIPDDPAVEKMLAPYVAKVRTLETVIGRLAEDLTKGPVGSGNLGNFVTDGLRAQASIRLGKPVLVLITNSGGLRKNTIAAGELRAADIFELLPFENALVEIELTGEQLLRLLGAVTAGRDTQSGARIKYRTNAENRPEMVSAVILGKDAQEIAIDPQATYKIVTIDYLVQSASGRYRILQEGKNVKPIGVTMRDALMDYVKAETAAGRPIKVAVDDRFTSVDEVKPEPKPE